MLDGLQGESSIAGQLWGPDGLVAIDPEQTSPVHSLVRVLGTVILTGVLKYDFPTA